MNDAWWKMQKEIYVNMQKETHQTTRIVNEHMVSSRIMLWFFN